MKYIQCPKIYDGKDISLFIAGGISGCDDWQEKYISMIKDNNITIINPRRNDFDIKDVQMSKDQIAWEFYHLNLATATSFWFPPETLCPITLLELGKKMMNNKPLFVGVHPDYKRKLDVEEQLKHERLEFAVVYSIEDLANQVNNWARNYNS